MRQFLPPRAAAELPVSSNDQSANRQVKNRPAGTRLSVITALHDLTINSNLGHAHGEHADDFG
jgi:hypothetical protein